MQKAHLIAWTLALIGALHGAAPPAVAAPSDAASVADRSRVDRLGYVVGDVIDRQVVLSAPAGSALEQASLPRVGTQSSWLALRRVSVRSRGGTPTRYEIDLRYQLINAPTEVRTLALPGFQARFKGSTGPAKDAEVSIGQQPVRIAPILPPKVPVSAALVRPDRSPPALSKTPEFVVVMVSSMLAITIVAVLVSLPIFQRRNAPFARACRLLKRAVLRSEQRGAATEGVYPSALRLVHRAFDQTAGWSLFPDRVGDFLAQWRQFSDLRGGIDRFLAMSQREFFESRSQEDLQNKSRELRWLLEFTHECRARERQVS